jgi:phospholipase/lecithinase/hemolysin
MKKPFLLRVILTVLLLYPLSNSAHPINNRFVFGDSLSDTGNAAAYLGTILPPPYFANRISNGPLAADVLAAELAVSADPYFQGGANFAVAGAKAGGTELGDLFFQLDAFVTSGYDPANALNLVFIGGNDVRKAASVSDSEAANVLNAALIGVDSTIRSLINAGAQQILVPNVFDIGLIPESVLAESIYSGYQARASALTEQYNMALAAHLAMIESDTGVDLIEFDLFDFSREIIINADLFGISNTTDSCLFEGPLPSSPKPECDFDTYAFFDTIHPTAKLHGLIGGALAAAVSESSSVVLMVIGLCILGIVRLRKGG